MTCAYIFWYIRFKHLFNQHPSGFSFISIFRHFLLHLVVVPSTIRRVLRLKTNPTEHQSSGSLTSSNQPTLSAPPQSAMANNPPHVADNAVGVLWCLVRDEDTPFMIEAPADINISQLKELIKEKTTSDPAILAKDLVISKVSTSLWLPPSSHSDHPCSLKNRCPLIPRIPSLNACRP